MKKLYFLILLAGSSISTCFAQTTKPEGKFSFGVEAGLPVGDYTNLYKAGFGGSLKYEIPAAQNFNVTLSAGYIIYTIKDEVQQELQQFGSSQSTSGFIPIKIGAKFGRAVGPFFEGQIGAAIGTASGAGTAFAFSPGVGYIFDGGFEAGFRYEGWSKSGSTTFGQLALRLAFRFK